MILIIGTNLWNILKISNKTNNVTNFNFIQSSNPLIRTIGAITLGAVLIYIFYLFSSEEQETVKSQHVD